jgi:predicted phosphoadenosine phosphosulfate sulfurtransferase
MNVMEAAQARIAWVFDRFEYVYVSFSGGKDSGVLLHLALTELARRPGRRMGVFHIDYEAQYEHTTRYVTETFDALPPECDKYWCAMPLSVPCATSMHGSTWIPWDADKRDLWVRDRPAQAITEVNHPFDFYRYGMEDYVFQKQFGAWMARYKGVKTACLIGVRADESYDRRIMLASTQNARKYPGCLWSTGGADTEDQYNFYPIHDWAVDDVWIYNARTAEPYNKLYDVFHQAGLSAHEMRVASPFISQGIDSIKLYRAIEPHTWGKLVSRVNGVNFAGIYGGTTAMGWRSITKPAHFTWRQYRDFLLDTLPPDTAAMYRKKFEVSERFWRDYGGALDGVTIGQIMAGGAVVSVLDKTARTAKSNTVRFAEYPDDLPAVADFKSVPSYKRMCVCILKNDHLCKYMGFTLTKEEVLRRQRAIQKYADL